MMMRATKTLGVIVALAFGAGLVAWWLPRPESSAGPCQLVAAASLPEIDEASGLAISRRDPAILWSHNDSGNATILFAIDTAGTVRGRVRVPVRTRDWEDVSAARCPAGDCLYLADIGDNRGERRSVQIYRVPEPPPRDAETAPPEVFDATYADGPHNAEAMFVALGDVFIITRDRTGGLYRSRASSDDRRKLTLDRIGQVGLAAVTDAEASRDEASVAVRTSHEVVFYRTAELVQGVSAPYRRVPIDGLKEAQGEGVAFAGDTIYLASERRLWHRTGLLTLRCNLSPSRP